MLFGTLSKTSEKEISKMPFSELQGVTGNIYQQCGILSFKFSKVKKIDLNFLKSVSVTQHFMYKKY